MRGEVKLDVDVRDFSTVHNRDVEISIVGGQA